MPACSTTAMTVAITLCCTLLAIATNGGLPLPVEARLL
jgi:hypothetical protein